MELCCSTLRARATTAMTGATTVHARLWPCRGSSGHRRCAYAAAEAERRAVAVPATVGVPGSVRHGAPSVPGTAPVPPVRAAARRPLLTYEACAGCRFDDTCLLAAEVFFLGAAALEGCSFSGLVSSNGGHAAVRVVNASTARVQNCTFSGNDADVHMDTSVLYTDTPPSALTLSEDSDNLQSIQPLADAPAGEFPTMASPAFVALRQVRLSRQAAAPPSVLGKPCDTARPEFENHGVFVRCGVCYNRDKASRPARVTTETRHLDRLDVFVRCGVCDLHAMETRSRGTLIGCTRCGGVVVLCREDP